MTTLELAAMRISRLVSCLLMLVLVGRGIESTSAQSSFPGIQVRTTVVAETESYKPWYYALKERNLPQVIQLGETFLRQYPDGKYSDFIKQIVTFARTSLNEDAVSKAKTMRSLVKSSLLNAPLESILVDIAAERADVNKRTDDGQTALMFAGTNANAEAVKALLQKGADVDAIENTHGWTALVYAIWSGDRSLVRTLLESYPDTNIKDREGRTASDHALLSCDFEIMFLIKSRPMRGVSSDTLGS
jgi:hypothetical protein